MTISVFESIFYLEKVNGFYNNFMENNSLQTDYINEQEISELKILNDLIEKLDEESIATLATLFDFTSSFIPSQKTFLTTIVASNIISHKNMAKDIFIEIINSLEIIKKQMLPKKFANLRFLNNLFFCILTKENEEKEITFVPTVENKNKETYIQLIPNGLIYCKDFVILQNSKPIDKTNSYFHSYYKIKNNGKKISLKFLNIPQELFFVQVLFYKKLTISEISQIVRDSLHVPNDITNYKATVHHFDHIFKLKDLIDSIQKNNDFICSLCHKKVNDISYY